MPILFDMLHELYVISLTHRCVCCLDLPLAWHKQVVSGGVRLEGAALRLAHTPCHRGRHVHSLIKRTAVVETSSSPRQLVSYECSVPLFLWSLCEGAMMVQRLRAKSGVTYAAVMSVVRAQISEHVLSAD